MQHVSARTLVRAGSAGVFAFTAAALCLTTVGTANAPDEKNEGAVAGGQVAPAHKPYAISTTMPQPQSRATMQSRPIVGDMPVAGGGVAGGIGVVCNQSGFPANCQIPDQAGHGGGGTIGATSDAAPGAGFLVHERLQFNSAVTITDVCWWGFYVNFDSGLDCSAEVPATADDQWTITFWGNVPGCPESAPGTVISSQSFLFGEVDRAPTGNVIPGAGDDFPEFEYHLNFLAAFGFNVNLPAGCSFISIQNDTFATASPNCFWLWSTAPAGDNFSYQSGVGIPNPENDFDQAMCLDDALGTNSDACDLNIAVGCPGAGNCGEAHGTPGCDEECCCTLVCAIPAFASCCTMDWDAACVNQAINVLGCASVPPCDLAANCQNYGTINAYNSTVGVFHFADDFTPAASGSITNPCWQGSYGGDGSQLPDTFIIRYFNDNGSGAPGSLIAEFIQGAGLAVSSIDTNNGLDFIPQDDVQDIATFQYDGTHAAVAVTGGQCYWIEITNGVAPGAWFWTWAEKGRVANDVTNPLARQGNGRSAVDAGNPAGDPPPDGIYDAIGTADDLSFCLGLELAPCACGFGPVFDTGPHEVCLFNGAPANLGWSSGDLDANPAHVLDHRRSAQPFSLSADTEVGNISFEGFTPTAAPVPLNETFNMQVFTRTSLTTAPTQANVVYEALNVPWDGGFDALTEVVFLFEPGELVLPAGDYWVTMYAGNLTGAPGNQTTISNAAWFTNAPDGINNACSAAMPPPPTADTGCAPDVPGQPDGWRVMLRARTWAAPYMTPANGFGAYALTAAVLDVDPANDPTPDTADLMNAAFRLRGYSDRLECGGEVEQTGACCLVNETCLPGVTAAACTAALGQYRGDGSACAPVCCTGDTNNDGVVNVQDMTNVILGWGTNGQTMPPIDSDVNNDGIVNVADLSSGVILNWGPCS